jgi:homoserine O-acetyltransferase
MDVADALYAGYGEQSGGGIRAGRQDPLFTGGNTYLKGNFPRLDYIVRARVLGE